MNRISGKTDIKIFVGVLVVLAAVVAIIAIVRHDVLGRKGGGLGKEFTYNIEELAHIDPNLILYEESADAIDTGFAVSHGIAVDLKGFVYVAGDKAVRIFAQSGDLRNEIQLADSPRCLTVVADGTIYVGLKEHIEVYDAQGQLQASWDSLGADALLTSIAVSNNNVFVADAGNRVVVRYDTAGKVINYIGKKDLERKILGFVVPSPYLDLAVSKDGLLRVVNPGRLRIEAYTFGGDIEFWWGESSLTVEGFCGCCNPVNIAVLPDGGFVTSEKGLVRVKVYDTEGRFVGVVAGPSQLVGDGGVKICQFPEDCQAGGFDVAVDATGRIFVLDTINNVVRIFSKKETS